MSSRHWRERVGDILLAIEEIQSFTLGATLDEFARDARTQKAVLADFTIIGEAARHVPRDTCSAHPDVPWAEMRDMRNFVVHGYFRVDAAIVWRTVHEDLPQTATALRRVLASTADAGDGTASG